MIDPLTIPFWILVGLLAAAKLLDIVFKKAFHPKVTVELGPFIKVPACPDCTFTWEPTGYPTPPACICRKCGSKLEMAVGQYQVRWTETFFSRKSRIIGFKRK